MEDPLRLLQQYNINKKEIIERDNQIIFGESFWPKNVTTNYLIRKPAKDANNKEYYTLECLLFFLKNTQSPHPEYVKLAAAANIPAVRRPDRKQLLAYLNEETTTCASIDESASSLENQTQIKRTHNHNGGESVAKKPRNDETHTQNIQKQLPVHDDATKEASVAVGKDKRRRKRGQLGEAKCHSKH